MDTSPSTSSPLDLVRFKSVCSWNNAAAATIDCALELSIFLGEFLCGQKNPAEKDMEERGISENPAEVLYQTRWEEAPVREDEDEEEKHFSMLMERLGANSVFEEWVLFVSTLGDLPWVYNQLCKLNKSWKFPV